MKETLFSLIILFFIGISFAQSAEIPYIEVTPIYKGEYKITEAVTKSIPPHFMEKVAGYNYQIKMRISFQDNFHNNIDSEYGIVCKLPGNEINKLLIVSDSLIVLSPRNYEYSFSIRIKEKGWLNVFIAEKEDFAKESDVAFYKNKSNIERHYLKAL